MVFRIGKLISPEQSGSIKQLSTLDNLISIESEIHEAFACRQEYIAIFVDICKAYDTVWRNDIPNN